MSPNKKTEISLGTGAACAAYGLLHRRSVINDAQDSFRLNPDKKTGKELVKLLKNKGKISSIPITILKYFSIAGFAAGLILFITEKMNCPKTKEQLKIKE